MKTLFKIAWRNIWRNKLRSLVVIISIVLGIWSGIFVSAFSFGLNDQRKVSMIENQISHIQVHHPKWNEEPKVNYLLDDSDALAEWAFKRGLEKVGFRLKANGMAATAHFSGGVQIIGINYQSENTLTGLGSRIDSGAYFTDVSYRNEILIGEALAEKLEVKPGSRVILSFSDGDQNLVSASFKVKGLYHDVSSQIEMMQVYVRASDLQKLLGLSNGEFHEMALLLEDDSQVEELGNELATAFPKSLVETWKELAPELAYADEIMTTSLYFVIGIIMLALSFGIINTMLMAVLERRKELGMLMSVGMSKSRVFAMIILETLFLALLGGPLGILAGHFSILASQEHGLNLAMFGDGLSSYGIGTIIYPSLPESFYWGTASIVFIMTLLSALYPARHALKLNPIETMRTL
jgi:putative ABC transport system permease protein